MDLATNCNYIILVKSSYVAWRRIINDTPTSIKNVLSVSTGTSPLVFDSPHSGTFYPDDFYYSCEFRELRKLEDAHLDTLFAAAPQYDTALLCAEFARSYIDPNRSIDDIDERMLGTPWPKDTLGKLVPTERSKKGVGLIPQNIRQNVPIYKRKFSVKEVYSRISDYYVPYHKTLKSILDEVHKHHGQVWHIDLHSMPSALALPKNSKSSASDIVLGDLNGCSCDLSFTSILKNYWEELGYSVTVNDPFKGAEIISRYGRPEEGHNSLQIEINRALYMNEATGKPTGSYKSFKEHCTQMIAYCAQYCEEQLNT